MPDTPTCDPVVVTPVPSTLPLKLYRAAYRITRTEALNCEPGAAGRSVARPGAEIAVQLRRAINAVKMDGINPVTNRVDYAGLRGRDAFRRYEDAVRALDRFNPLTLTSDAERKAFWINLYNALILHAVIAYGVRESITEIRGVFDRAAYVVGGYRFSADDIEHGILRANRGHPAIPGARFAGRDPRAVFALKTLDPRIHFTLNCGATSCPPIGFYDAEKIDAQLTLAAQHFLTDGGLVLDRDARCVQLSRIFSWYARDFGGAWYGYRKQGAILRALAPYMNDEHDRAFIDQHADDLRVRFQRYDWSLNV